MRALSVLMAGAVLLTRAAADDILMDIGPEEVLQDTAFYSLDPSLADDGELVGISSADGLLYHRHSHENIGGYPGQGGYPGHGGYPGGQGGYPVGGVYPGQGGYPVGGILPGHGGSHESFVRPGICPPSPAYCHPYGYHRQLPCRYDGECYSPGHRCCFDNCIRQSVCKGTIPYSG